MPPERRAIVTGAARGIGAAITRRLLRDGWSVRGVFNSSSEEAAALAAEEPRLELLQADLGTPAGVERVVEAAGSAPVHALVNNAGVVEFEQIGRYDRDVWTRTFEVNLFAPVHLTTALADRLESGGAVVNVASTDAFRGSYNSIAYAASKAALLSATRSFANVLGPKGVRVNAVTPGWIDTEMADKAAGDARELTPLGRLGKPEDVADCVAWMLGAEAAFLNGAGVVLDGGLDNVDYVLYREAREQG